MFEKLAEHLRKRRHAEQRAIERAGHSPDSAAHLVKNLEARLAALTSQQRAAIPRESWMRLHDGHSAAISRHKNRLVVKTILARGMRPRGMELPAHASAAV